MPHGPQRHRVGRSLATIRSRPAACPGRAVVAVVRIVGVPQKSADLLGDIAADGVDQVLIPPGHGRARPPHDCHRGRRRHAEDEQHGRGCMASVVEPRVTQPGFREEALPLVVVGVRILGPASRGCEHPASVMPELAGSFAFDILTSFVRLE